MFAGLLAEIRAYGEGLVIAEQIPARLVPDVIKNTAVKMTHRLPAADDREAVGATMNATQRQSRYLVTLPPGQAAVFSDGMDFPVLVKIKDGSEREAASPAPTADARTVVAPGRAPAAANALARPCTLREMRGGQRLLDDVPLGPAVGGARGARAPDRMADAGAHARRARRPCGQLAARLTQCALAHAVDAAVAARPAIAGAGRARRARGGGDPRLGGTPRVALLAR